MRPRGWRWIPVPIRLRGRRFRGEMDRCQLMQDARGTALCSATAPGGTRSSQPRHNVSTTIEGAVCPDCPDQLLVRLLSLDSASVDDECRVFPWDELGNAWSNNLRFRVRIVERPQWREWVLPRGNECLHCGYRGHAHRETH